MIFIHVFYYRSSELPFKTLLESPRFSPPPSASSPKSRRRSLLVQPEAWEEWVAWAVWEEWASKVLNESPPFTITDPTHPPKTGVAPHFPSPAQ